jgi:hypothetical protein
MSREPEGIFSEDRAACEAIPVLTLTMNGRDCPEVSTVDAGVTAQLALAGTPVHVRLTAPAKFAEFSVRLNVAVEPACTVSEVPPLFAVSSVKVGAVPDPVSDMVCDPLTSLSVTVRFPVRAPTIVGVKRMLIVQLDRGASTEGQLLVWVKSPEATILPITSGAVPELTSFACSTELEIPWVCCPKSREDGVSVAELTVGGGGASPVPSRVTVRTDVETLVCTESRPLRSPTPDGEKMTLIVQAAPAARVEPQVFACA